MRRLLSLALLLAPAAVHAQTPAPPPTIAAFTAGMTRDDGFVPVVTDARRGAVYLDIATTDEEFLYQVSLPAGLGSNDIGLDRGQLGPTLVVRFERAGSRMLLVAPNVDYRASSANAAERRSVRDAFAESVLFAFPVVAEENGRVLVDATPFVLRDAHGVVQRLQQANQGSFALDAGRSSVWWAATKAFPDNTELEGRLTFASANPGGLVRSVAADGQAVTLRERHSFVRLPDAGYVPRRFDPRSGFFDVSYADYSAPLEAELRQRLTVRHRLEKRDPSAAVSDVVEPIVYYLDNGTPEPVRSALLDGARWWAAAFEAAGFRNAFRVEVLPDSADPMDVRYNVIQWVHRSTRGWSYGAAVADPRTGEILKGHVSLGSLRVRQDYLIAEGLLAPYAGGGVPGDDPMALMALARLRQLAAHEVGHTLGLAHNFAASTNRRASVMDYPAPYATLRPDGSISLDSAYAVGVGAWDIAAIRMGYGQPAPGQTEADYVASIVQDVRRQGLVYLSDRDNAGGVEPRSVQWDNGRTALDALRRDLDVRRAALARFSDAVLRPGRPAPLVEEAFVPLYLRHRYAVAGAAKLLGGQTYAYALRGDGSDGTARQVPAADQTEALRLLLSTLTPDALRVPPEIRALAPRPPGYEEGREDFAGRTGIAFDPFAPAEVAAAMVFDELLRPDRAARLAFQRATFGDETLPTFGTVLDATLRAVWDDPRPTTDADRHLVRAVQAAHLDALLALDANDRAAPLVRAQTREALRRLHATAQRDLRQPFAPSDAKLAWKRYVADRIEQALNRPLAPQADASAPLATPPGAPIGAPIGSGDDAEARHRARLDVLRAWDDGEG